MSVQALTHVRWAATAAPSSATGFWSREARTGETQLRLGAEGATAPGISQAPGTARAGQSGKRPERGHRRGKALRSRRQKGARINSVWVIPRDRLSRTSA